MEQLCDNSQWVDYYVHINGLSGEKSHFQLHLFGLSHLSKTHRNRSSSGCTATPSLKTRTLIPEHCASSLLSSVTLIPPSHPNDSEIPFFRSRAFVPSPLLLKQICKLLRKDKNTASKKKKTQYPNHSFPERCSSTLFTPLQCKKTIQG